MSHEDKIQRLRQSAMRFTAYRERAPKEVRDKLKEWGAGPQEIDNITRELIEGHFLDEQRFANAFCHDKFLINKWGRRKIRMEIAKYELPEHVVAQGLEHINPEKYKEVLLQLARAKWQKTKEQDPFKKKQKTMNYLLQKGYEPELIHQAVDRLSEA